MWYPEEGEEFIGKVDRISNSGNGIIQSGDWSSEHINLGTISEKWVGEVVRAKMTGGNHANLLGPSSQDVESGIIEEVSDTISETENGFSVSGTSDMIFCPCGSLILHNDDRDICSSCQNEMGREGNTTQLGQNKSREVASDRTDIDEIDDTSLNKLRKIAEEDGKSEVPERQRNSSVTTEYNRSEKVKQYVKARANGECEGCGEPAPFVSKTGDPYLHAHHIHEVSMGGADTPDTVIALCPNCHYRVHHGKDGEEYNQELLSMLQTIEDK